MTEEKIKEILKRINEPYLKKDFTSLDFIYEISLKGDLLKLRLGITDTEYGDFPGLKNKIAVSIVEEIP